MAPLASEYHPPSSPTFPSSSSFPTFPSPSSPLSSPLSPPLSSPTSPSSPTSSLPPPLLSSPPRPHPPRRLPSELRKLRRLSSYDVFREEVPLWAKTHPLKPIPSLFVSLFKFLLISGPHWVFRVFLMFLFVVCMAPAWVWGLQYYLGSTTVVRNIRYGKNPRNYLDICLPQSVGSPPLTPTSSSSQPLPSASASAENSFAERVEKRPVVVFVTGGIWLIGYKAWGMFVAKVLSSFGIFVVLPDYRNFPQGTVSDMLDDVDESLNWVVNNIEQFGGDKNSVFVMGQSAGAHLTLLTLLRKVKREQEEVRNKPVSDVQGPTTGWSTSNVPAVIGIAGPYNVQDLQEALHSRGLSLKLLYGIMEGEENLERYSADYIVNKDADFSHTDLMSKVPPVILLHGTADLCVPYQASKRTAEALAGTGIRTFLRFYPGKSHTDSIIEDLVYAEDPCKEDMMTDIATIVLAKTKAATVLPAVSFQVNEESKQAPSYRYEEVPQRESDARSVISSPDSVELSLSYSTSEEFEVHVEQKEEFLRPSFRVPRIENPKDFDLKAIRRSVLPRILWQGARMSNPF